MCGRRNAAKNRLGLPAESCLGKLTYGMSPRCLSRRSAGTGCMNWSTPVSSVPACCSGGRWCSPGRALRGGHGGQFPYTSCARRYRVTRFLRFLHSVIGLCARRIFRLRVRSICARKVDLSGALGFSGPHRAVRGDPGHGHCLNRSTFCSTPAGYPPATALKGRTS